MSRKLLGKFLCLFVAVWMVSAGSVNATVIFSQDFADGLGVGESTAGNFGLFAGQMGHSATYGNDEYSFDSFSLDLTRASNSILSFDYDVQTEGHYDRFNVYANGDATSGGDLVAAISGIAWQNTNDVHRLELGKFALSGTASGRAVLDLAPFEGDVVDLIFQFGSDHSVVSRGVLLDNILVSADISAAFEPSTFTSNDIPAVPEPSTWALLASGFAGLVLNGRRRKKT